MKKRHYPIDFKVINREIDILILARELGLEVKGKTARCINSQAHKNNDKTFSMSFNPRTNKLKCFACNKAWSVLDLYMAVKALDINEAGRKLAGMIGLAGTTGPARPHQSPVEAPKRPQVKPELIGLPGVDDFKIYADLSDFCGGVDSEALAYLTGETRGLTREIIERFKLFSIKDGPEANKYLKGKYTRAELERAGLIFKSGSFVFNKHRLIIPFMNGGQITYLQGRTLDGGKAKYNNLYGPQVPLFNAGILTELKPGERVYITEGVFDAMILEQMGARAVAILGASNFKDYWADLFKGLDVWLFLDNDPAGTRETARIKKLFKDRGQEARARQLPEGVKDITEFYTRGSRH